MSFSTCSAGALPGPDFCFIFAPCGYDEPEILPSESPSICLMRADGEQGVSHGLSLAEELGSKVTIITVTESFPVPSIGASEEAKAILSAAKEAAEEMGLTVETLHIPNAGSPATAIVDAAKTQGCDLIVMSSHGHRGIRRAILGSRTAEVLANSRIPVLVVHGSADRSDDGET